MERIMGISFYQLVGKNQLIIECSKTIPYIHLLPGVLFSSLEVLLKTCLGGFEVSESWALYSENKPTVS